MKFPNQQEVLGHGFRFKPAWWSTRLPQEWAGFLNDLPAVDSGYHTITRADVLMAAGKRPERCLPRALVAGCAWGTGTAGFQVGCRTSVFRYNTEQRLADRLGGAAQLLCSSGPAEAYESLLPGRANHLKHLGPSFFTRFLYAANADGTRPGDALILDAFIATALCHVDGWDISLTGPWDTRTYERWLEHAHNLAAASRGDTGRPVRADAVEMAYYIRGRAL